MKWQACLLAVYTVNGFLFLVSYLFISSPFGTKQINIDEEGEDPLNGELDTDATYSETQEPKAIFRHAQELNVAVKNWDFGDMFREDVQPSANFQNIPESSDIFKKTHNAKPQISETESTKAKSTVAKKLQKSTKLKSKKTSVDSFGINNILVGLKGLKPQNYSHPNITAHVNQKYQTYKKGNKFSGNERNLIYTPEEWITWLGNGRVEVKDPEDSDKYIVNSSVCKIPHVLPFDERYPLIRKSFWRVKFGPCNHGWNKLTTMRNGVLRVDEGVRNAYFSKEQLTCVYAPVIRVPGNDNDVTVGRWRTLRGNATVRTHDFVAVKCQNDKTGKTLYKNMHAQVVKSYRFKPRSGRVRGRGFEPGSGGDVDQMNVIMLGVDSVSRMSMLRNAPELHHYLTKKLGAIPLHGYSKVGINTLPNLWPLLSGKTRDEMRSSLPWLHGNKTFDDVTKDFLWSMFRKQGYVTQFGEDDYRLSTFNYKSHGFKKPPTAHYFRTAASFMHAHHQMGDSRDNQHCYGPKQKTRVLLDWVENFARVYKNHKYFSMTHFTSITHSAMNRLQVIKGHLKNFFRNLMEEGLLENTAVFFYSDHGYRMPSEFSQSDIGGYEQRTPFFYLLLPNKFLKRHKDIHNSLKINSRRLTSNFDIYQTLLDILHRNSSKKNYLMGKGQRGRSLFLPVPFNRNCEDANIPAHFCLCFEFSRVEISHPLALEGGKLLLERVNNKTRKARRYCVTYKSTEILSAEIARVPGQSESSLDSHIRVSLRTWPGLVGFKGTITLRANGTTQIGEIEEMEHYYKRARCISYKDVAMFCFCREFLKRKREDLPL